jgi:hypothetical protein
MVKLGIFHVLASKDPVVHVNAIAVSVDFEVVDAEVVDSGIFPSLSHA